MRCGQKIKINKTGLRFKVEVNSNLFIDLPDPNTRHRCGKSLGGT